MSDTGKTIRRNRELLKRRTIEKIRKKHDEEDTKEALRIFKLLPQGPGSELDADTVDGLHAKEIISRASGQLMPGGHEGGVTNHGALTGLLDDDHTQYYGSGLREPTIQNADDVDDAAIGDDKILVYNTASSKHEYEAKPAGGGDMTKAVYDGDDDGVVDDSENTQAIDGKALNAAAPNDKQLLQYDAGADEWAPVDPDVTIVDVNIPAQSTTLGVTEANSATIAGDTTSIDGKITACNTGAVTISAALPAGTNSIGKVDVHGGITYDHAFFNAAADGNLVAAVAGKVIKVHSIALQAAGTVVVNIRSNNAAGTILTSWTLQAREGICGLPFAPYPAHWFQTGVGEALFVDVTAAVNVTVNCIYSDDDAS
jgi:hypothetical protein